LLRFANSFARQYQAQLFPLTVLPSYSMSIVGSFFPKNYEKKALDAAKQELKQALHQSGMHKIKGYVVIGKTYDEILKAADKLKCDLILLRARNHELSEYLIGANAERVASHSRQSVLIIRGELEGAANSDNPAV